MNFEHRIIVILLLLLALPAITAAQESTMPAEVDSGDEYFPFHGYLRFLGTDRPMVNLFPGEGISGLSFRERPDGGQDWMQTLELLSYNSIALDWPGTGRATTVLNQDYIRALRAHLTASYDTGRGTGAKLSIAHAEAAALLIKARSYEHWVSSTAVLIDPIGPQYSQPLEPVSFEQALERRERFDQRLWQSWGFGPRPGVLNEGLDLDLPTAMQIFEDYDRQAFQIRPALLQPIISPLRVRGPARLAGWRVLMVRTSGADEAQVKRETALTAWLQDAGVHVDHLDLGSDPAFASTTGLPWVGESSTAVIERFVEWFEEAILLVPEPELPTAQGS